MATDGLWDVLDPETVSKSVFATLDKYPVEKHRYTMVAQELVAKSRGRANDSGHWRLAESKAAATVDDISVLVIPVNQYYEEYVEWRTSCLNKKQTANPEPEEHKGETHTVDKITSLEPLSNKNDPVCEAEEAKVDTEPNANQSHQSAEQQDTQNHLNGIIETTDAENKQANKQSESKW